STCTIFPSLSTGGASLMAESTSMAIPSLSLLRASMLHARAVYPPSLLAANLPRVETPAPPREP
ncbi:MAG TPA: hypothetical protein VHM91_12850, partial [Verrucomicrobiales bacterium]|nr:hypothetical protein [Verrucomicrobiales bacterium]